METVSREERTEAIEKIVKLYEIELQDCITVGEKFDVTRLPKVIQKGIRLVTAKSPTFSNISACTTVNYVFMHLLGQLRPVINDIVYSNDTLGLNYYAINIAASGGGKDSSRNTMMAACKTAFDLIHKEREDQEIDRAKRIALAEKIKEDPNAQIDDLQYSDYIDFVRDLAATEVEASSTRGGLVSVLNRLQSTEYGSIGVMMNEFGLALKQNNTVQEVLELLGTLFDQGVVAQQAFKTLESKEQAVSGMYPNTLLHSSPKIVFGNKNVSEAIANLFHTMLARRCWFSMPTELEAIENNPIVKTIDEIREIANKRRVDISVISSELDNISVDIVRNMLASPENRIVNFSEEAQQLYIDYFEYNQKRGELKEDSSIQQVEINGRAFKTARLAALWSLMGGNSEISKKTLTSAIYFAEYNSKYLDTFVSLTTAKAFRLLGDMFKEGKFTEISLDRAIMNGYIGRISNDFKDLLEPMNSYLTGVGVATYDIDNRIFKYTPFKKVKSEDGFGISYTKVPGLSKDDRSGRLGGFDSHINMNVKQLTKLVSTDTIYNAFDYTDGVDKNGDHVTRKRNRENINSSTKLLVIDVDDSEIPIDRMHGFLKEFIHVIATTSDVENKYKFRILLPIDVEIDGKDNQLYKCIAKNVCERLLVKFDPVSTVNIQGFYGYEGAETFSCETGELYAVADIVTDCMENAEVGLPKMDKPKTPAAVKKNVDMMLAQANKVFEYVISCPRGTGSLSMARASFHMRDAGFSAEQYENVINYLNSLWQTPMPTARIEGIISQFSHQMKGN